MDLGFFLHRQQFWDTLRELLASAKQKVLLLIKENPEPVVIDTSQSRFFFKYTQRTVTPNDASCSSMSKYTREPFQIQKSEIGEWGEQRWDGKDEVTVQ